MAVAVTQGADQNIKEQFGVRYLTLGRFGMQNRGIEPVTF